MLIFIDGGIPGVTPYVSGPHLWDKCLSLFDTETTTISVQGETVDVMVDDLKRRIQQPVHLVGHDLGGLVALALACEAPEHVRSVTAVASVAAAPTGDGVPNLTFAHPPMPRFSRESQRWALERISYSHHHIDDDLLDACVAAGTESRISSSPLFLPSLMEAKSRFYAICRDQGFPVPAQVIWGTHDPLGSFEQGLWLFRVIAQKQKAAHFHAINRSGALPFREEPQAFHQIVSAFVDGLEPVTSPTSPAA